MNIEASDDPIVSSWVVIDIHAPDMQVGGAETPAGLTQDLVAANLDGIINRETMAVAAVVITVLISGAIPLVGIIPIAAAILVTLALTLIYRSRLRPALGCYIPRLITALIGTPSEVEGVAFRSTVFILDLDNRGTPGARLANQVLTAPPVDSREMEVRRIRRHG